jgi:hypothetical protein
MPDAPQSALDFFQPVNKLLATLPKLKILRSRAARWQLDEFGIGDVVYSVDIYMLFYLSLAPELEFDFIFAHVIVVRHSGFEADFGRFGRTNIHRSFRDPRRGLSTKCGLLDVRHTIRRCIPMDGGAGSSMVFDF